MKTFYTLVGFGLAVAFPSVAATREVEVRSFSSSAKTFQIIDPGLGRIRNGDPEQVVAAADPVDLDREFTNLSARPVEIIPRSSVEDLSIPSWMRGNMTMSSITLPPYTSLALENCGAVSYAPHPTLSASQELRRRRYFTQMAAAACGAGVPVDLFDALIIQESRYNPTALSSKGASGLTQLMPGTARALGVFDRWSIAQNLAGGARYLRKQLDTFGNWELALGAYNAGPGNVAKYGGLPPFRETRGYVRTILSSVNSYQTRRRGLVTGSERQVVLASFNP